MQEHLLMVETYMVDEIKRLRVLRCIQRYVSHALGIVCNRSHFATDEPLLTKMHQGYNLHRHPPIPQSRASLTEHEPPKGSSIDIVGVSVLFQKEIFTCYNH
jgi:hypothetical protein